MAVLNNKFLDFTNANNNLIGNSTTGASLTSGAYNNFFGRCAGNLTSTGDYNNFIGDRSGQNNTSGRGNNFLGGYAGQNNTSGRYNNFFGVKTGWCNQTGCDNIFFGRYAGCANVSGHNNIYMNSWSGRNATGCGNIFIGHFAGCTQTSGNNNVVIGSTNAVDTLQISGIQLPITTGSNQLVIGVGNTSWINGNSSYNVGIGTTNPVAKLHIGPGSSTIAPLEIEAGTVLTTPVAGSLEYDGTIFTATPSTNFGRGSIPTTSFTSGSGPGLTVGADESFSSNSLFPNANNSISTLPVGTYKLTAKINLTRPASTTSATLRIHFTSGGAAGTFSGISIGTQGANASFSYTTSTVVFHNDVNIQTAQVVTAANVTSTGEYHVYIDGILRITTAGFFTPSWSLSANLAGSGDSFLWNWNWLSITQISSSGTTVSTGTWA